MLYYLLTWLDQRFDIPGFGVFQYISFRAIMSVIFSLLISMLIGKRIIQMLRNRLIGEVVRDAKEGPDHAHKKGTPTMGGLIIIAAILIPTLLWADLRNGYVWLILVGTVWIGLIGFVDDYIKVFKKDKKGLKGKFKLAGQVSLGLLVGLVMLFHPDFQGSRAHLTNLNVVIASPILTEAGIQANDQLLRVDGKSFERFPEWVSRSGISTYTLRRSSADKTTAPVEVEVSVPAALREQVAAELFGPRDAGFVYRTDFPFMKDYVFDYAKFLFLDQVIPPRIVGSIIYLLVVIFIITAVSNAVNLTDGIDGLAAGTSAITGATLGAFAYIGGNAVFSNYLNISYIPFSSELLIYATAFVGACMGFLWYNAYPAQVFMGDTGSLTLGGALGIMSLMVKKELLIPIICGVFLAETLSVMMQVGWFKWQKRRHGVEYAREHRLLRMAPLHHHYEKGGMHESKIVTRFWIISFILAALAFATLKLR